MDSEKFYREDHTFYKIMVGDFNAKIGRRRTPEELHIGTHGLQWNEQEKRLSEFIMTTETVQITVPEANIPMMDSRGTQRLFFSLLNEVVHTYKVGGTIALVKHDYYYIFNNVDALCYRSKCSIWLQFSKQ
ncbi:hypothetical protein Y032_0112g319 [Ancylostoma ceylanicum]|uniref:Endonuclease/exonuclease/phosphatase domain-containing protein n=1 Tax=Ancylostoma ceylanicum TaxID=53326 RepID=A0A016TE42_9BILA|nr:hypothetical protein Y032_0112g319 [Ancylostoma ceylanicum]